MASERPSDVKFEIGHILFIDIVGYSRLLIHEQTERLQTLKEIVRGSEQFQIAEREGKLLRLPSGDGGALVFRNRLEAPVLCAVEIGEALRNHPELHVRMGIHSGPVNHILVSKHVAEDLDAASQNAPDQPIEEFPVIEPRAFYQAKPVCGNIPRKRSFAPFWQNFTFCSDEKRKRSGRQSARWSFVPKARMQ